jgi:hypothetical protein
MPAVVHRCFGNFRLDPVGQSLWRNDQPMVLTPKAFAILAYLSERPGQLITKAEFFDQLWPKTAVGDAALGLKERHAYRQGTLPAACFPSMSAKAASLPDASALLFGAVLVRASSHAGRAHRIGRLSSSLRRAASATRRSEIPPLAARVSSGNWLSSMVGS